MSQTRQPDAPDPVADTRTVAVLTHVHRPEAIRSARQFIEAMADHRICSAVPAEDVDVLELDERARAHVVLLDAENENTDTDIELAVVFGGDGTILRGAEWTLSRDIPLLGVNLGHVGFLAELESSQADELVEAVASGDYVVEERMTCQVVVRDKPLRDGGTEIWSASAVNEVSIEKAARERMLELLVAVDDRPLSRWGCDGVLVATPTGSTAYAFSAGGPVMWPGIDALLMVPVSAHALFARPMVLGPNSTVAVQLVDTAVDLAGVVWCDGRRSFDVEPGMEIEVVAGEHRLRLAQISQAPFTDRLVRKFGLRVEGWRGVAEQRHLVEKEAPATSRSPRR